MTVSATFDPVLSRVRIEGSALNAPVLTDTFTRTVANGWGTSDTGQTYTVEGGAVADFSTTATRGRHRHQAVNTRHYSFSSASWQSVDLRADLWCLVTATGGSISNGVMWRVVDSGNHYLAQVLFGTTGVTTLGLFKKVTGSYTQLGSNFAGPSYSPFAPVLIRVYAVGATLKAKIWTGTAADEPAAWGIEVVDSTFAAAGPVGVHTNLTGSVSNTLPVNLDVDNLTAQVPAAKATVRRSIDQASYTDIRNGTLFDLDGAGFEIDDYEFVPNVTNHYRVNVFSELNHFSASANTSATPTLDTVWFKSLRYPFLNTPVVVSDFSPITRAGRNGVFPIAGRSVPVAVTDVRSGRRQTLTLLTHTEAETDRLDLALAAGEPVFVHAPLDCPIRSMFAVVDASTYARTARRSDRRRFDLPLVEVEDTAGPVPVTFPWASVVRTYGTWQDVINANADWSTLIDRIGEPADLVVL